MLAGVLVLLGLPVLLFFWLLELVSDMVENLWNLLRHRRDVKRARIEADLDRTQAELRATILDLAAQLGGDAHEARKALIRESYLASGSVPAHGD